ncbi:hypothetical protein VMCG_09832 [Cytospora schulzeri]|uniref:Heterokaryon incompatibility domain-containing protein n=1 Tax=Cytospora schulzeri TaxID=448051 RepID=A0A423VHU7_9PEZI|nr:hypothetical protein VMCG_09832 [Valsa malicola]
MARAKCNLHAILLANPPFFSPENDISGFEHDAPRLHVPPLNVLRRCAHQGCDLCTVVTAGLKTPNCLASQWGEYELEQTPLQLSRSMLSCHEQIALYNGFDDIMPPTHFFRIPSPWKEVLPRAHFDFVPEQRDLIACWVDNCLKNHPKCQASQQGFRPTRLLQVDCFGDSKDLRLVEFNSVRDVVPYVALSHCWGPPSKRPISTTRANIGLHTDRISFEALSRTFREAVAISRDLGQSYLWIDSLCIVQDDGDDWAREAALMAEVYRESFCTIAAHSARDGDDGCRVNASDEAVQFLRYVDLDIGEYRIRLVETIHNAEERVDTLKWDVEYGDSLYKYRQYGHNPLRIRAWTLQERELSVRAIHFSRSTLLWECLEMKGSTEVPHKAIRRYDEYAPAQLPGSSSDISPQDQGRWYGMVEDYSSRFLTVESDKLPAMAGLARNFQRDTLKGGAYMAGLWKELLPGALLWRVRQERQLREPGEIPHFAAFEPRRPMRYRAPSWSWACPDGEITYASQRVVVTNYEPLKAPQSRIAFKGVNLEVKDPYLFQAPRTASMTVHGQTVQATFEFSLPEPLEGDYRKRQLYSNDGDAIGFFYPDIIFEVQFIERITCLGVCDEVDASTDLPTEVKATELDDFENRLMGLALLPDPESSGEFKRVGLIRWLKKSVFQDVVALDIRIH